MAKHINLNRLAYFTAVVETRSFTAAAQRLSTTKAVVSQQVARLEEEIGTTLLIRTTRNVHATEAGLAFYARCITILREAEDAFDALAERAVKPSGLLRITATFDYGISVIVPKIAAFTALYPACEVDLSLSDERIDLVSSNIDMAIRVGWLSDSTLQARRIDSFRQILVASPQMAPAVSHLDSPRALETLPFVANSALRHPLHWNFSHGEDDPIAVRLRAAVSIDATLGVLAAVQAGAGLSVLPDYIAAPLIGSGELIHVLPDWSLPIGGIFVVFPAARYRPAHARAFVDLLSTPAKRCYCR
ncbi:bacterial regulatory helix-turn-helix protein, lysR family protein [Asticcacaulis biprosthecium C19]|uniref:Bacterial regulatory helix-turn-helix protein, lysR family protein n=1 Tax=Asticcacaulis biprosthecium C19 TaxID=715226 RepID=F4QSF4_9CAUL|nr:LysR family transcriptional regulator [Asticcacaulis biprosthecium]EGF89674.1 bacterial regulatory helix-turn-helix protein, lysR family protein [Asticcacaulis biprosthecium C19]